MIKPMTAAAIILTLTASAARATLVTGSFAGIAADVSDRLLPNDAGPPMALPVKLGDAMTGSFSYDTNLAQPGRTTNQFVFFSGARLTVASDGLAAVTDTVLGPITVNASGNAFQITGSGPVGTDPFGLVPRLSLLCGTVACPPNGVLPTSTFSLSDFSDVDAQWLDPRAGEQVARFHITEFAITAVPEPAQLGLVLAAITLLGTRMARRR